MVGHRITVHSHLAFLGSFTIERRNPKLFQKHIVINKIKWNLQEYLVFKSECENFMSQRGSTQVQCAQSAQC